MTDILATIAAAEGREPTELWPPLGEEIDVGALERLLNSADGSVEVQFRYREWAVTVRSEGRLVVESADGA